MNMQDVISYIIKFLIGGEHASRLSALVGYTNNPKEFGKYKIIIIPSAFFKEGTYGKESSIPQLPLNNIDGIPLLFGEPILEKVDDILIVYADIIASAYFMLTRYEEIRKRNIRDAHGRFPGKESLPYRAGFINRPIVDEYGKLLRKWLQEAGVQIISEPQPEIKKVWLTHDVDAPFYCKSLRHLMREIIKGKSLKKALKIYKGPLEEDPYYTFPWLLDQARSLKNEIGNKRCKSVVFLKAGGKSAYDKPRYNLVSKSLQELMSICDLNDCEIGLHTSYESGENPALIEKEKKSLEKHTNKNIYYNRNHFLRSCEPEDLDWLERNNITDDFTMGYADVAGFRLGTCKPVNWINPENKRVSSLVLHPLIIMECSLSEPKYMNLTYKEALSYCQDIIEKVKSVNGELVLLWHNTSVSNHPLAMQTVNWHNKLYNSILENLKS